MEELSDIENVDTKEERFYLKWTKRNSRRNVCVDFKSREHQTLLAKRVYQMRYRDIFFKRCTVLDETNVHRWNKLCQNWCFFLMSAFRYNPKTKLSFDYMSAHKNLLLIACRCWDHRPALPEMNQSLILVDLLVMKTPTCSWFFLTARFLDYMQVYMMLLEQSNHRSESPGYYYMIGWGPNKSVFNHVIGQFFCLSVKLLLPSIFKLVGFWSKMSCIAIDIELADVNVFMEVEDFWWECSGIILSFSKKVQSYETSASSYDIFAWKFVEQGFFGLKWASRTFSRDVKGNYFAKKPGHSSFLAI